MGWWDVLELYVLLLSLKNVLCLLIVMRRTVVMSWYCVFSVHVDSFSRASGPYHSSQMLHFPCNAECTVVLTWLWSLLWYVGVVTLLLFRTKICILICTGMANGASVYFNIASVSSCLRYDGVWSTSQMSRVSLSLVTVRLELNWFVEEMVGLIR